MPFVQVGQENSAPIQLYYEDLGTGKPVILIHGWPLSGQSWEKQVPALLAAGYRVIAYDRRGFGRSDKPSTGYDYDTFAADLHALISQLDLRELALVGFSMGGGEVARYVGKYGSDRVQKAVFMAAVPPYLQKEADNPEGVDASVFEGVKAGLVKDRPAFLAQFLGNFYGVDKHRGKRISDEAVRLSWNIAVAASPIATLECVSTWGTDFRQDLAKFTIPTLVVHGDSDAIVPLAASGARTQKAVSGSELSIVAEGPHGLNWTHAEEVNKRLVEFLGSKSAR